MGPPGGEEADAVQPTPDLDMPALPGTAGGWAGLAGAPSLYGEA